jgi:putative ABC transport system permease protein
MALGAQRRDVLWLVMREGTTLIGLGLAAGLACAAALSGLLRDLLFSVSATQPSMYVIAAIVLTVVGVVASYLPARRATAVPSLDTLRAE